MEVFAAGAICWRESGKDLLVAVIHRGRYQDWTFPKGKVDSGETLAEAAVREVPRTWRFVPGKEDGKPVAMWHKFAVTFRLENR
jgi:ADP-ribose pyrophosphatase YjhB (NUDIX family)